MPGTDDAVSGRLCVRGGVIRVVRAEAEAEIEVEAEAEAEAVARARKVVSKENEIRRAPRRLAKIRQRTKERGEREVGRWRGGDVSLADVFDVLKQSSSSCITPVEPSSKSSFFFRGII